MCLCLRLLAMGIVSQRAQLLLQARHGGMQGEHRIQQQGCRRLQGQASQAVVAGPAVQSERARLYWSLQHGSGKCTRGGVEAHCSNTSRPERWPSLQAWHRRAGARAGVAAPRLPAVNSQPARLTRDSRQGACPGGRPSQSGPRAASSASRPRLAVAAAGGAASSPPSCPAHSWRSSGAASPHRAAAGPPCCAHSRNQALSAPRACRPSWLSQAHGGRRCVRGAHGKGCPANSCTAGRSSAGNVGMLAAGFWGAVPEHRSPCATSGGRSSFHVYACAGSALPWAVAPAVPPLPLLPGRTLQRGPGSRGVLSNACLNSTRNKHTQGM